MGSRARTAGLVAGAVVLLAAPAAAHDFWIDPSTFTPPVGAVVAVRLRVGERHAGEPVPRDPERIVRFELVGPLGDAPRKEKVPGFAGWEPAGQARPTAPGLHALVYRSTPVPITLPAEKFEAYLAQEGLDAVLAARAARGDRAEPGREIYSRCAKALLDVGGGAAAAGSRPAGATSSSGPRAADRPLGLTLELVAERDPYRLAPGGELPVRLLYRGEPLAGALVMAIPADEPTAPLSARSDRRGGVAFRLGRGGRWLVKAVHMIPAPAGSGADWESLWASLTFAVPAA
jgi:hypothetical protein